ncbi:MAG: aldehyde ferredoxin oxidoreductase C-terminal domain-containing protein [Candidatus Korobacteraceae bacterium]
MHVSFDETRNDPNAVLYSRCTIDLSSRDVRFEDVPCRNLEEVLGGIGRSLQFLAERTVTNAYTPENPLIVNTGIFTGSSVMTGLRTYFSAYSPLKVSNKGLPGAMWAAGSGKFGSKLRWTGVDEIILEGRSSEPVIIVVRHGADGPTVELKSANHLLGLECYKKILLLNQEYTDAHFAAIGPAGENYEDCYFGAVALSTVNLLKTGDDKCRWAGRGGMGSVMGYKGVIAIVAQAPDQLERLKPEIRDINRETGTGPSTRKFRDKNRGGLGGTWCTYELFKSLHFLPQNNFRPKGDGKPDLLARPTVEEQQFVIKAESCFRCGINCHKNVYDKTPTGERGRFRAKFDYEPLNLLSTNLGIHDPDQACDLVSLVDHLGMDSISIGTTIGYVLDYNERHPEKQLMNGATFGAFDKIKELVAGAAKGRYPEIGHGVKRLSEQLGEPAYAMHCKGIELPAYLPDTNPGYPFAIAGGHMSMATPLVLMAERDTSLEYWVKAITQRGLFQVRDDMTGICKFSLMSPDMVVKALKYEIGLEITTPELLATVRRIFMRGLRLERQQGFERSDYTLPSEVFDRPNNKLGVGPFITREFFSKLSEEVWSVFDKEVAAL